MAIITDAQLTDLESEDALAKRLFDYMSVRPTRTYSFKELRDFLGFSHGRAERAMDVLKRNKIIMKVGWADAKRDKNGHSAGTATYRLVLPKIRVETNIERAPTNGDIAKTIAPEIRDEKLLTDVIDVVKVAAGHTEWCKISDPKIQKCTCPHDNPAPEETPVVATTDEGKHVRGEDVLRTLIQVGEASSTELATLMEAHNPGLVSVALSKFYHLGIVNRKPKPNGRGYIYMVADVNTFTGKTIEETLSELLDKTRKPKEPAVVKPEPPKAALKPVEPRTIATDADAFRTAYLRDLGGRILTAMGSKLNDFDQAAIRAAFNVE